MESELSGTVGNGASGRLVRFFGRLLLDWLLDGLAATTELDLLWDHSFIRGHGSAFAEAIGYYFPLLAGPLDGLVPFLGSCTDVNSRARALRLRARGAGLFLFLPRLSGVGCFGTLGCWVGWCRGFCSARAFLLMRCTVEVARGTGRRRNERMEQGFHVGGAVAVAAFVVAGGEGLADPFHASRVWWICGYRLYLFRP